MFNAANLKNRQKLLWILTAGQLWFSFIHILCLGSCCFSLPVSCFKNDMENKQERVFLWPYFTTPSSHEYSLLVRGLLLNYFLQRNVFETYFLPFINLFLPSHMKFSIAGVRLFISIRILLFLLSSLVATGHMWLLSC